MHSVNGNAKRLIFQNYSSNFYANGVTFTKAFCGLSHDNTFRAQRTSAKSWKPLQTYPKFHFENPEAMLRDIPGKSLSSKLLCDAFEQEACKNPQILYAMCRMLCGRFYYEMEKRADMKSLVKRDVHTACRQLMTLGTVLPQNTALTVRIVELFKKNQQHFSTEEKAEMFISLLYLGLQRNSTFTRHSYVFGRKLVSEDMGWFGISMMLKAADVLQVCDYTLHRNVLKRIGSCAKNESLCTMDPKEVMYLLETIIFLPPMISPRLCKAIVHHIAPLYGDQNFLASADRLSILCQASEELLNQADSHTQRQLQQCVYALSQTACTDRMDFSFYQLAAVWRCFEKVNLNINDTVFAVGRFVNQQNLGYLELKDLLPATAYCSFKTFKDTQLQVSLRQRTLQALTSRTASSKLMTLDDYRLVFSMLSGQKMPVALRDELKKLLIADVSRLPNVSLASVKAFRVKSNKQQSVVRQLNSELDKQVKCKQLSSLWSLIMNNVDMASGDLPFDSLRFLRNFPVRYTSLIFQSTHPGQFANMVAQCMVKLLKQHNSRMLNTPSLPLSSDDVLAALHTAIGGYTTRDNSAIVALIHEIERWLIRSDLTFAQEFSLYRSLLVHRYEMPKLFNHLVGCVLSNSCDNRVTHVLRLASVLALCAKFDCRPKRWEELSYAVIQAVKIAFANDLHESNISMLSSLACFDVYPEQEIRHVFYHDYLQKYLTFCAGLENPAKHHVLLSSLSESVCIFRPEWGIELYSAAQRYDAHARTTRALEAIDVIYKTLVDICGGEECVKKEQRIGLVDHFVDFVVAFDAHALQPVSCKDAAVTTDKRQLLRVAIVTLNRSDLVANNPNVVVASRRRMIQCLTTEGYHVIAVVRTLAMLTSDDFKYTLEQCLAKSTAGDKKFVLLRTTRRQPRDVRSGKVKV